MQLVSGKVQFNACQLIAVAQLLLSEPMNFSAPLRILRLNHTSVNTQLNIEELEFIDFR